MIFKSLFCLLVLLLFTAHVRSAVVIYDNTTNLCLSSSSPCNYTDPRIWHGAVAPTSNDILIMYARNNKTYFDLNVNLNVQKVYIEGLVHLNIQQLGLLVVEEEFKMKYGAMMITGRLNVISKTSIKGCNIEVIEDGAIHLGTLVDKDEQNNITLRDNAILTAYTLTLSNTTLAMYESARLNVISDSTLYSITPSQLYSLKAYDFTTISVAGHLAAKHMRLYGSSTLTAMILEVNAITTDADSSLHVLKISFSKDATLNGLLAIEQSGYMDINGAANVNVGFCGWGIEPTFYVRSGSFVCDTVAYADTIHYLTMNGGTFTLKHNQTSPLLIHVLELTNWREIKINMNIIADITRIQLHTGSPIMFYGNLKLKSYTKLRLQDEFPYPELYVEGVLTVSGWLDIYADNKLRIKAGKTQTYHVISSRVLYNEFSHVTLYDDADDVKVHTTYSYNKFILHFKSTIIVPSYAWVLAGLACTALVVSGAILYVYERRKRGFKVEIGGYSILGMRGKKEEESSVPLVVNIQDKSPSQIEKNSVVEGNPFEGSSEPVV